ncbi:uncharacterized protein METZ01_LOCUS423114, partial [marine metagenome]
KQKIKETLDKKEQVILLHNRRSHSYLIKCNKCNNITQCPNCYVSLKYHINKNILKCHHCSHTNRLTKYCTNCKTNSMQLFGLGTQKLELILNKLFPQINILRYDRDSSQTKNNYQKILEDFEKGKAQILIGTQMIAKGLDFKNVSLVSVINADIGMMIPDFRSGEKNFQLLYQLIGRSGRHRENSFAIIQTYNIEDKYILYACKNEVKECYDKILKERKELFYPPFSRLIRIVISGTKEHTVQNKIDNLYRALIKFKSINILGPTKPLIE